MSLRQGLICEYRSARNKIHRRPYTEREWAGRILWGQGLKLYTNVGFYKKPRFEDVPHRLRKAVGELLDQVEKEESAATESRHP
jgi:hypothetical protein